MGIIDDPISGVLGAILQHVLESKIAKRAELVLELAIAGTIAYFLTDGSQLILDKPWPFAHGCGLVAAGLAMLATFMASPNSKGLTISLQKDLIDQEKTTPMETEKK